MDVRYLEETSQAGLYPTARATVLNRFGMRLNPVAPLVFALHVSLVFSALIPESRQITGFAESAYINNGRMLFEGILTPFGYSPLSSFVYALTYIPVQDSPYWLVYSCSLGRILLFTLLWTSAYLVATSLSDLARPLVAMALVVASPAFLNISAQAGHALFCAMSALALWQFLLFYQRKTLRHLVGASLFLALTVLARSGEGLILWVAAVVAVVWLSWSSRRMSVSLATYVLPCAIILASYVLTYRSVVGRFDLGMAEYSYFTFEQGHGLAHQSEYPKTDNFYVSGQMDAQRLFGTPEENDYSIPRAILRNPGAYLERIPGLFRWAPMYIIEMYGGILGCILMLFAARGVIELGRRKFYTLLAILLLWASYLPLYFLLVYQPMHFLFPSYIVFVLAAVGLQRTVANFGSGRERLFWFGALGALLLTGFFVKAPGSVSIALFWLINFTILWMLVRQYREVQLIQTIGIILLLATFLVKAGFPPPRFPRQPGTTPDEKATLFMKEQLSPTAVVGSYEPKNVWMAKLIYVPMFRSTLSDIKSDQDLISWMKNNHLKAIYADPPLKIQEPAIWSLVQRQIGRSLEVGFSSDEEDYQVLLTTGNISDGNLQGYVPRPWYSAKERFPNHPDAE